MKDNLNEVVQLVAECGLVGSQLAVYIDTDYAEAWGMHIKTDGASEYFLSTMDNGGYMLQAAISTPQALVSSGPHGIIGITRDPDDGVCQIFLPSLTKDTLMDSLRAIRISLRKLRQLPGAQLNHNN